MVINSGEKRSVYTCRVYHILHRQELSPERINDMNNLINKIVDGLSCHLLIFLSPPKLQHVYYCI